jgi:hypothetical protein
MLGVLVNTNYTLRPLNLASILERLVKALYSYTATQLHSYRSSTSSDRLQLSYSKLGV